MAWDQLAKDYVESKKYDRLTPDTISQIRSILPLVLTNAMVGDYDVRAACPFHPNDGSTQTLRVNLDPSKSLGIGFMKCYSCGTKGHLNKLLEHLGADLIRGEDNPELRRVMIPTNMSSSDYGFVPDWKRRPLPKDYQWLRHDGVIPRSALEIVGAELWPRQQMVPKVNWVVNAKGVKKPKPIKDADGKLVVDFYADELRIWMPVLDRGDPVAYVAALDGKREWYSRKYLNASGDWPKRFMFPLEQVMQRIPNRSFIVIVEGPADALKLISAGIPAIANLGVSAWTREKAEVLACHYDKVYICLDSDEAGQLAQAFIKETFKGLIPVSSIKIGSKDPASLSDQQLAKLSNILKRST